MGEKRKKTGKKHRNAERKERKQVEERGKRF